MSQNQTPATSTPAATDTADATNRAAATKALLDELHRKTHEAFQVNSDLSKPVPDQGASK